MLQKLLKAAYYCFWALQQAVVCSSSIVVCPHILLVLAQSRQAPLSFFAVYWPQPELACLPACSSSSSSSEGEEEETRTSGPGFGGSTRSSPAKRDSQGRLIGVDTLIQVSSACLHQQEPPVWCHSCAPAHDGCVKQPAGATPMWIVATTLVCTDAVVLAQWLSQDTAPMSP